MGRRGGRRRVTCLPPRPAGSANGAGARLSRSAGAVPPRDSLRAGPGARRSRRGPTLSPRQGKRRPSPASAPGRWRDPHRGPESVLGRRVRHLMTRVSRRPSLAELSRGAMHPSPDAVDLTPSTVLRPLHRLVHAADRFRLDPRMQTPRRRRAAIMWLRAICPLSARDHEDAKSRTVGRRRRTHACGQVPCGPLCHCRRLRSPLCLCLASRSDLVPPR